MKPILLFTCWIISLCAFGQEMVTDLNTATIDSDPLEIINANGTLYFFALEPGYGNSPHSLWKSDGTSNGTTKLTSDLAFAHYVSSYGTPLAKYVLGNNLYWLKGSTLYKSDGTADGTIKLKEFNKGVTNVVVVNNKLFITTYQYSNYSGELWISDGTSGGTVLVKSFTDAPNTSLTYNNIIDIVTLNGQIYFGMYTGNNGVCCQPYVWKSDGTANGTVPISNALWSNPFVYQNSLYYLNSNGLNKADADFNSTSVVNAVPYGLVDKFSAVQSGSVMYFLHSSNPIKYIGDELWRTDGTNAGTVKLYTDPDNKALSNLTDVNGNLVFASGYKVYKTDGTVPGTTVLKDFTTDAVNFPLYPSNFTVANNKLFFSAYTLTQNAELWTSDGTVGGTHVVTSSFSPSAYGLLPASITSFGTKVVFAGTGLTTGRELFISDGTEVTLVKDIDSRPGSSAPSYITAINDKVYFAGTTTLGKHLWQTDGTSVGTTLAAKTNISGSSGTKEIVKVNDNAIVYSAFDGTKWSLYSSLSSTPLHVSSYTDPVTLFYFYITAIDGKVYFTGRDNTDGSELWISDLSTTQRITDLAPGTGFANCTGFTKYKGAVYFSVSVSSDQTKSGLYTTDGTTGGTVMIKNFTGVSKLTVVDDQLFFFAYDATNGTELWKTDGTTNGTVLVKDINPGTGGSDLQGGYTDNEPNTDRSVSFQHKLFFWANNGTDNSLWSSDGTAAGTTKAVSRIGSRLTVVNNKLFFTSALPNSSSSSLFVSDGTANGTVALTNNDNPNQFITINNNLVFSTYDGFSNQLKMSDGTKDGTYAITSLSGSNGIVWTTAKGNTLYFSASDATHGTELWKMEIPSALPTITTVTQSTTNKLNFTIKGTNLSSTKSVIMGGAAATSFTVISDTEISVTVANVAASGAVRVNTTAGSVTKDGFAYAPAPSIVSFVPVSGAAGTEVTIVGDGLNGVTAITIGGVSATFTITSNTLLKVTVPTNGASGSIVLTTPGGSAKTTRFQFYPVPAITSITPAHALAGAQVVVKGTGFFNVSNLKLTTTAISNFTTGDSTSITFTVPSGVLSGRIQFNTGGGLATSSTDFIVDLPTGLELASAHELIVYPNPSSSEVRIKYSNYFTKDHAISIYDSQGKKAEATEIVKSDSECSLNITNLKDGLYIMIFTRPGIQPSFAKVIKQ